MLKRLSIGLLLLIFFIGLGGCKQSSALEQKVVEPNSMTKKTPRIINGTEVVDPDAYPWMVGLIYLEETTGIWEQECGGSLIGSKWVITAAHCVDGVQKSDIKILLGTHNLNQGGELVRIKDIKIHDEYNFLTIDSDIALIELEEEQNFPTLDVVSDNKNLNDINATALGWGYQYFSNDIYYILPEQLRQVNIPVISNEICSDIIEDEVTENMLCAGVTQNDGIYKDTAPGDSGGPLVIYNKNEKKYELIGITSWGEAGNYGVYTKVSNFKNWILSHTQNSIQKDASYYINQFYNQYTNYFGTKSGDIFTCYQDWKCQNFVNGTKIAAHNDTYILIWWDGSQWTIYGDGSEIFN